MASAVESDYLVIGTGIAGLSFALKAAEVGSVTVITKKESQESNTNYAQGGIASVLSPDDSFDLHTRDTLEAGAGLCKRDVVDLVVKAGPRMVQELIDWGVKFTREKSVTRQKRVGADKASQLVQRCAVDEPVRTRVPVRGDGRADKETCNDLLGLEHGELQEVVPGAHLSPAAA